MSGAGLMFCVVWFVLLLIQLIRGVAVGTFAAPAFFVKRSKYPFEYWISIVAQCGLISFFAYLSVNM
jgi:hypothetical protein